MAKRKGFKSWFIDRTRLYAIKIRHHKRIAKPTSSDRVGRFMATKSHHSSNHPVVLAMGSLHTKNGQS